MKLCNACGDIKHVCHFRKGEWTCNECRSQQRHDSRLVQEYGITREEQQELLRAQGGRCAICQNEFEGEPLVDHDHKTMKVRGLLCNLCNTGIGFFQDSPQLLLRGARYLAESAKIGT